ncbi:MAG TPA: ferrous iron transport protein A [Clostridiaceae bacterium]|nr:ferrous iron transport protein A [Clostridiaceae bacterium]
MTLDEVAVGATATIKKVGGSRATRRRIMDMGLTRNTKVLVRKLAPLGDPMQLSSRGFELSIRKADAAMIEVECVSGGKSTWKK